jgi:hypothetical protein
VPSQDTLERFIARVEQHAHAEAVEEFYSPDSSMRENQSEPRVGRDFHVANERKRSCQGQVRAVSLHAPGVRERGPCCR